jgi:hypothetical protein
VPGDRAGAGSDNASARSPALMICGPGVQRQRQQAGEGLDESDGQARNSLLLGRSAHAKKGHS